MVEIDVSDVLVRELIDELREKYIDLCVHSKTPTEYKEYMGIVDRLLFAEMAYNLNGFYCPTMVEYIFELYFPIPDDL